jgi:hypothetical protein
MKKLMLHIIPFLCVSMTWSQKVFLSLEASATTVEKGQNIIITIKTNVDAQVDFDLPDEFKQSGATQSGMSSSMTYHNGRASVVRFSYEKLTGHFEEEGTYRIGPAKIQTSKGEVTSNILKIEVVKRQNMISENPEENLNKPIFGIIQQSKREIYEGEALVLEGKVYAQLDILEVESYQPFKLQGPAQSHQLDKSNQVTSRFEKIGGRDLVTFCIGKTLIFPEMIGVYEIEAFETILRYNDQRSFMPQRGRIRSNESSVTVLPLPDGVPADFIQGVGRFSLHSSVDSNQLGQGEVLTIDVHIEGYGNLHNIKAPKLKLPKGMVLYGDPEEKDSVAFTVRGAEGRRTFTYYVQLNKPGEIDLPKISLSYFDIATEQYETLQSDLPKVRVTPSGNDAFSQQPEVTAEESSQQNKLLPPIADDNTPALDGSFYAGFKGVLWSCSPIALALILGLFVRYRKSAEEERSVKNKVLEARQKALRELDDLKKSELAPETLQLVKRSIQQYIASKFDVGSSMISVPFIQQLASEKMSDEMKRELVALFNTIDELRYSGGAVKKDGEQIAEAAAKVINKL